MTEADQIPSGTTRKRHRDCLAAFRDTQRFFRWDSSLQEVCAGSSRNTDRDKYRLPPRPPVLWRAPWRGTSRRAESPAAKSHRHSHESLRKIEAAILLAMEFFRALGHKSLTPAEGRGQQGRRWEKSEVKSGSGKEGGELFAGIECAALSLLAQTKQAPEPRIYQSFLRIADVLFRARSAIRPRSPRKVCASIENRPTSDLCRASSSVQG